MRKYLTIKEMEKLKNLGIDTSISSMVYVKINSSIKCIPKDMLECIKDNFDVDVLCETFTLQDIIDIIPMNIDVNGKRAGIIIQVSYYDDGWSMRYPYSNNSSFNKNLLLSCYKTLCWLAKNGYISKLRNKD